MLSVSQAGETCGQDGALYRQHSVQDRCRDREAGRHGEGQTQEERRAGPAAGRGHGGEYTGRVFTCNLQAVRVDAYIIIVIIFWCGQSFCQ